MGAGSSKQDSNPCAEFTKLRDHITELKLNQQTTHNGMTNQQTKINGELHKLMKQLSFLEEQCRGISNANAYDTNLYNLAAGNKVGKPTGLCFHRDRTHNKI